MAAPVWLGFIFLLDPLNARLGGESLLVDLRAGRRDRLINLALSGLLCGVLWEFWNYWAGAKWHYTVPIMENLKVFEMPVPGYLGFPAFAVECFTMYVFVRTIFAAIYTSEAPASAGPNGRIPARPNDRVVICRDGSINSRMAATLEREIKLPFARSRGCAGRSDRCRRHTCSRPPAAGRLSPRHPGRAASPPPVGAARADGIGPELSDLQGTGAAVDHEAARGARNRRGRWNAAAARASKSWVSTSGSATRSTARNSRSTT